MAGDQYGKGGKGGTQVSLSSFKAENNEVFKPNDIVTMQPPESQTPPFIARIVKIIKDKDGEIKVQVAWYYRPEEAEGGRKAFHGERELFKSDHTDWCPSNSINGRCRIHTLKDYQELRRVTDADFFWRFDYVSSTRQFKPDRVPVYCACELPYNPDRFMVECERCHDWFHPECVRLSRDDIATMDAFVCESCTGAGGPNKKRKT